MRAPLRHAVATACVLVVSSPVLASAQTTAAFKVAFYNIQSGKGEPALPGRVSTFPDTINCTDPSRPLNAWGLGIIQRELRDRIGADPSVVALGLAEAWTCAAPGNVAKALGWRGVSSERNGVAIVARFGFAGPEEWQQLDTTLNANPDDTMWVVRVPVCLDALCTAAASIAAAHWYATIEGGWATTTYDRQASETVAFLRRNSFEPHILLGDLNVWEAPTTVCGKTPIDSGLKRLRDAGYTDAWPYLHGTAEGFTGMTNRPNCGIPEGYVWKRIDYAWSSPGFTPVSMTRFGVVPAGEEAPSDHYGIIVGYQRGPVEATRGRLGPGDALIRASQASVVAGNWRITSDASAAGGRALENPDRAVPKRTTALAAPADYFDAMFTAEAGRPYRLWVRGRAAGNAYTNDSVFVQFSGTVSAAGEPVWRIGSTAATAVSIEECSGCGLAGWGWTDNGYGTAGPLVYFGRTGTQTIRIQAREDGITIDQILLSPELYLATSPGLPKNDTTIIAQPSSALEIVRYASDMTKIAGDWVRVSDASAAGGTAVRNPDRGAAKLSTPLATPVNFVEVTFHAEARRPYRLWLRGRADANSWTNDSVFVQFNGSLNDAGIPAWRIGSTSAFWISVEDCSGCGLAGWGWQDNGYGLGVLGPLVYFETTGTQTMRIQQREDGMTIDQIVLSAERYLTARPGAARNDTTIVPR